MLLGKDGRDVVVGKNVWSFVVRIYLNSSIIYLYVSNIYLLHYIDDRRKNCINSFCVYDDLRIGYVMFRTNIYILTSCDPTRVF